jgi:hypothetical protein
MLVYQLAIVPEAKNLDSDALGSVAAAIQKQISRDFAPIWELSATVDAFSSLEKVPLGYWPIIVTMRDLGSEEGVHLDKDGQPYSLVEMSETWSVTASHECLELLVDPYLNRITASVSPADQSRVEYLVEVCDPCQAATHGYTVNGVLVSDFFTPRYFDPEATTGAQYSFTGRVQAPRAVLEGGYLSWKDPVSGDWWQRQGVGGKTVDTKLGPIDAQGLGLRRAINARTPHHRAATRLAADDPFLIEVRTRQSFVDKSSRSRAARIREHVDFVTREKTP